MNCVRNKITMSKPKSTVCLILFAIFLYVLSVNGVQVQVQDAKSCAGKLIYIRKLPTKFNLDLLLNCSRYPVYDDFCPYLANHGLGQKTHNRTRSWYRTDPFMLELIFHRRVLEYPCLTDNPREANGIYLPYYSGIDSLRYLYGEEQNDSAKHGLDLFRYLKEESPEIWAKRGGEDHFLVMARQAWDFSQAIGKSPVWGTSFLELPEFFNVTALTLESRAWPWQEQAIPYPTSFHPANLEMLEKWIGRVRRTTRNTLMLFAGGGGVAAAANIRHSIRVECEDNGTVSNDVRALKVCKIVDCSLGVCEHDPIRFIRPMLESNFCLQPPGDTPTRRSTFDGILAGCIPVFFEESSAQTQFGWHLPEEQYKEFSVLIPKEEVVLKGLKIVDVLQAIPKGEVRRMREKVIELIPRVIYRRHGALMGWKSKKDAFDLAVDGALDRIKSKLAINYEWRRDQLIWDGVVNKCKNHDDRKCIHSWPSVASDEWRQKANSKTETATLYCMDMSHISGSCSSIQSQVN